MINTITFSKAERRIIICFLFLGISLQYFSFNYKLNVIEDFTTYTPVQDSAKAKETPSLIPPSQQHDSTNEKTLKNKKTKLAKINKDKKRKEDTNSKSKRLPITFDPNTLDSLGWLSLNLKPWVVSNIMKYKRKGGFFKDCKALERIYGLSAEEYERISSNCQINNKKIENKREFKQTSSDSAVSYKASNKMALININTADTSQLMQIYGIGPKLSSRIIKYRNNLGGFYKVSQLEEVYGIEKELVKANTDVFFADGPINKININTASKSVLVKHYYIDFKIAQAILNYRHQHGLFASIKELKNIKSISDKNYQKISPYLSTQ